MLLSKLRTRWSARMHQRRSARPTVETMESRRLLTAIVPAGSSVFYSKVASVTNTVVEGVNTLINSAVAAPTLTVKGTASANPTTPDPVITLLGAQDAGPHTVFVHALDSNLGVGTPLTARYQWNFGDTGSKYNDLVGWDAAHTYLTPGTYTITLTLTNQNWQTAILSTTVTITPSTQRIVYVDSVVGSDKNSGLSPTAPIKTVDRLIVMLKAMGSNTEFLFHTGETFNVDKGIAVPFQNVTFGSYGPLNLAPPVLMRVPGSGSSIISMFDDSRNVIVENLTFDSIWKPVGNIAAKMLADGIFPAGSDMTVRDCTFLNLDVAVANNRNPQGVMVQDCTAPLATGLRGVFIWGQGTDQVALGNVVANSTREHDIRTVAVVRELLSFNNLTNLDRSAVDPADTAKGTIDVHRGTYAYVNDNYLYGGELRVGPREGPAAVPGDTSSWCVFEANHVFDHEITVYPGTYHVMIRNNIVTDNFTACIGINASNEAGDNIQDITLANNTGISTAAGGQFVYISGGGNPAITIENNLWVAPKIVAGMNGNAAIYISDTNPSVIALSHNNVWQLPSVFSPYAAGGLIYVYPSWLPPHGYYTPTAWDNLPNVNNDLFSNTPINATTIAPSASSLAAYADQAVAGVFVDSNGAARLPLGLWTAGAVQV